MAASAPYSLLFDGGAHFSYGRVQRLGYQSRFCKCFAASIRSRFVPVCAADCGSSVTTVGACRGREPLSRIRSFRTCRVQRVGSLFRVELGR